MIVDFRSDTFTKPTPAMMESIVKASVGDDVFGEDPTVNALERKAAELFGMEAALYCPSGTMSNQIGIRAHTNPGDEVICEKTSHVYLYEGGGIAVNAGCQVKLLEGVQGKVKAHQIEEAINPDDIHRPISRLVSLENSTNRGGGNYYDLHSLAEIKAVCEKHDLKLHLDGARLFNAMVAAGQRPHEIGEKFDSISICLNKGLGCPMGSILMGSAAYIKKSRRIRKVMGGGLRQAGYMAAAGVYALDHHIDRLADDHAHAQLIADAISHKQYCKEVYPVKTNIIIFEVAAPHSGASIVASLKEKGILAIAMAPMQVRLVLHLDVTKEMVDYTLEQIKKS
ncbi:MAG: DegT/DnrJ/EryC1/StrS family aminotransferase [Chitinophagaceae bacterium]|nr:DegT/DnrJ/EryC1/StrS family aminotransferase [Chitinophagaceae bacterium]